MKATFDSSFISRPWLLDAIENRPLVVQRFKEAEGTQRSGGVMKKRNPLIFGSAFFDGVSMAGFFGPLRRPGAPTQLFADPEPDEFADRSAESALNPGVEATASELERAKKLPIQAGFHVIPAHAARLSQR